MDSSNLFDRVGGVESQVADVSAKMDILTAKIDGILTDKQKKNTVQEQQNSKAVLKRFIEKSKKEYIWFGDKEEFSSEKKSALIWTVILICVVLLATIATGVAANTYSTFSLFENIWLIMMMCVLGHLIKAKRFYDCIDFSQSSCIKFVTDADGVYRMDCVKKKYKVFLIINCICAGLNAIGVWVFDKGALALMATILEIAVIVLSIIVFEYKVLGFFYGYCNIRFIGKNETTGQRVVLIHETIENKLYIEEEYATKFPFYK